MEALLALLVPGLVSDGCMKRKESILYHFTLGDSGLKSASETCAEPCNRINVQHVIKLIKLCFSKTL